MSSREGSLSILQFSNSFGIITSRRPNAMVHGRLLISRSKRATGNPLDVRCSEFRGLTLWYRVRTVPRCDIQYTMLPTAFGVIWTDAVKVKCS